MTQFALFAEPETLPVGPPVGTLDGDLDALAAAARGMAVWCGPPEGMRRCVGLRPSGGVMQHQGRLMAVLVMDLGPVGMGNAHDL